MDKKTINQCKFLAGLVAKLYNVQQYYHAQPQTAETIENEITIDLLRARLANKLIGQLKLDTYTLDSDPSVQVVI